MKIKFFLFLLLYQTTFLICQTSADFLSDKKLSLKEATTFALDNNPEINKIREQIFIKNGEWWSSFGIYSPTMTYAREGIDKSIKNSFSEQRWHLIQSIDFPLTTYFRLNKISSEKEALNEKLKSDSDQLVANVKFSYVDVLYSQRILNLREKQINLAEELKKAATSKLEAGEIAELELMKSEIQLAEAQNFYEDAVQQFHKSRYALFDIIGLDPSKQKYDIGFDDSLQVSSEIFTQHEVLSNLEKQPLILSYKNLLESPPTILKKRGALFYQILVSIIFIKILVPVIISTDLKLELVFLFGLCSIKMAQFKLLKLKIEKLNGHLKKQNCN